MRCDHSLGSLKQKHVEKWQVPPSLVISRQKKRLFLGRKVVPWSQVSRSPQLTVLWPGGVMHASWMETTDLQLQVPWSGMRNKKMMNSGGPQWKAEGLNMLALKKHFAFWIEQDLSTGLFAFIFGSFARGACIILPLPRGANDVWCCPWSISNPHQRRLYDGFLPCLQMA